MPYCIVTETGMIWMVTELCVLKQDSVTIIGLAAYFTGQQYSVVKQTGRSINSAIAAKL